METKHTPGPWEVEGTPSGYDWCHITGPRSSAGKSPHVATIIHWNENVNDANARLIAAAPEMYEALKGMLEWARRIQERNPGMEIADAVSAISKAEGR